MLSDDLIKEVMVSIESAVRKQFNETRKDGFKIQAHSISKPLCQLMMQRDKASKLDPEYNHGMRMLTGLITEALMIPILKAAGLNVTGVQEKLPLKLVYPGGELDVNCVLDCTIDSLIWDIKSASSWSYSNKMVSYENIKKDDPFGYVGQLYSYRKAKGINVGGWIIIDKSSWEIKVVEFPQDTAVQEAEMQHYLKEITNNVKELVENEPFRRSFEDIPEVFHKKATGNRVLGKTCEFCDYKYSCWPNLIYTKSVRSEAKDPPWKYYTKLGNTKNEDPVSES